MKVKKIKEDQLSQSLKCDVRCFNENIEDISNPDHFMSDHINNQYVCLDDWGKMMGKILVGIENAGFDGQKIPVSLIGNVATYPEYRHMGCIREIFEFILPNMYKDGILLSQLFPFSKNYYRRYGYDTCGKQYDYKWRLDCIPNYDYNGFFEMAETAGHLNDLMKIHKEYVKDFSMAIDRNRGNFFYNFRDSDKLAKDKIYTSIYYDKDKKPIAYFVSKLFYTEDINYIEIKDMAFTTIDGLKAILSFIKNTNRSDCLQVWFSLTDYFDLSTFLTEDRSLKPYNTVEYSSRLMARVINVKEVLKRAKYNGTGNIAITVDDKQIPENNGIFTVEFENGEAVSVEQKSDGVSDVFMSISIFSRLILGDLDAKSIPWLDQDQIKFACSTEKLGKVFFKKPLNILDRF